MSLVAASMDGAVAVTRSAWRDSSSEESAAGTLLFGDPLDDRADLEKGIDGRGCRQYGKRADRKEGEQQATANADAPRPRTQAGRSCAGRSDRRSVVGAVHG